MKKISLRVMKLLALIITCCLIITTVVPITAFAEDISGHWAIDDINFLRGKGLVQGDSYGNINPDNNITRAEFIALTNRTFEFSEVGETNFPDVEFGAWYYDDLAIAKNQGYIQGDYKGNAYPSDLITRAEVAVALARILDLTIKAEEIITFADSKSFPGWSVISIISMTESGLVGGYPDNTFRASNYITRAEAITIMSRIIGVNGEVRTITSFDKVIVFASIKTAPRIPAQIKAHYNNGLSGNVSVAWDSISTSQYDLVGTFTVQGSVTGTSIQPSATVTVSPNAPVTFADSNFKAAVVDNLKQLPGYAHYTNDSDLYPENLAIITKLDVRGKEITSMGELSYFTNLEWLDCGWNDLTTLDVSDNTVLQYLSCSRNNLTTLDVSNNLALTDFSCTENKLTTLDVSNNPALTDLSCSRNNLTTLDVSNNQVLQYLRCSNNNLGILDVSTNKALKGLNCSYTNLTTLDVSNNTALEELSYAGNNLSTFDVSKITALWSLDCSYTNLTTLDVSNITALGALSCEGNNLGTLDVSNNTVLRRLNCSYTNLTTLDVSNNTALEDLSCAGNNLGTLDVSNNTALIELYCSDNNPTTLDVSNNKKLLYIECGGPQLHSVFFAKDSNKCTIEKNGDGHLHLGIFFDYEKMLVMVLGENVPSWVLSGTTIASSVAELNLSLTSNGMAYSGVNGTKLVANF